MNRCYGNVFILHCLLSEKVVHFPPDVLSDFLFKAPDATTGNTASLNWNLGRVSGVSVHYVMCNIALGNKRKEHAQTSFAI